MSALKCIERKPQSMSFGFKSHKNSLKSTILLNQTSTLSKQFFTNLIELETRFQNKSCTSETLNQLVQHYAKAVEYYDQVKDDIASYFAFKIQDILATKKSMTMLLKTNQKLEDKENVRPSQNSFIESKTVGHKSKRKQEMCQVEEEYQSEAIENSNEDKPVVEKELHKTMKNIKNKKKRFVNLFCKVESEIDNTKQNMNATLTTFETSQCSNDNYIQTDLISQKEKLRKRLERRKFESFSINVLNASNSQYPSFIIPEFSERKDLLHPGFVGGVSDVGGELSEKYRFSLEVSSECELQSANLSVEELEAKILEPSISGSQEIDKQEAEKDVSSKIVQLKNGENDSFDDEKNSTETDTNSEV